MKLQELQNSVMKLTWTYGDHCQFKPGHKEYYISFTDDSTKWTHLQLLATKDGVFKAYKNFEAWAKLHFKIPTFKTLHSDRGGEYLGKAFS